MRSSFSWPAAMIAVGLLVVACGSTATPAPATSPASSLVAPPTGTAPRPSPSPLGPVITAISTGWNHTCALTSEGGVKCWGANDGGQLGDGTTTDSSVPVDVPGLTGRIRAIAAGAAHTCAITGSGGVKCWGGNELGGLGNGTTTQSSTPVDVSGLSSGVSAIAAGGIHTCAITDGGGVKCWGYNGFGGLGDGSRAPSLVPVDVVGLASGVSAIAAGYEHTCALTTGGGVKCWGSRTGSALGNGATSPSLVPVDVPSLASGVTAIVARGEDTCALTNGGGVTCWGEFSSSVPVEVAGLGGGVTAITAGPCALTSAGGVKCWGDNSLGQLGDGTTNYSDVPVDVLGFASGVSSIASGQGHTCALTSGGAVWCWGDNSFGQLGNGRPCSSRNSSSLPVDVAFTAPSAGSGQSATPIGRLAHATGSTDVVLRFDIGPDIAVGDQGEFFQPGPEFTLYGDGTVIFRNDLAELPPTEGPIVRGQPFMVAHLDEDQIQSLLGFALGAGGLGDACERYERRPDSDAFGSSIFTIRAGGLDRRVEDLGSEAPLGELAAHLRTFDQEPGVSIQVWAPDRYWGSLLAAGPHIESGVLPDPNGAGVAPWPWPGIKPADFSGLSDLLLGRRVMSAQEAAVLGLSRNGGVVQRIYLRGPDGTTIYDFSLWPMMPDEPG